MSPDQGNEPIDIVDADGNVIGRATRAEVHGNPALMHRVVHILVFNRAGDVLLQKRSLEKDIQPGKWDTSVGGHLDPGEDYDAAARRELFEELGIREPGFELLYDFVWRSERETELVRVYGLVYEGPIVVHPDEIDAARFWTRGEIEAHIGRGVFTPLFEKGWLRFKEWEGARR
jgi:isopentenyl-diphosphate delta-isomerase type 1